MDKGARGEGAHEAGDNKTDFHFGLDWDCSVKTAAEPTRPEGRRANRFVDPATVAPQTAVAGGYSIKSSPFPRPSGCGPPSGLSAFRLHPTLMNPSLSRRSFLGTLSAGAAATFAPAGLPRRRQSPATRWPIGCFNRPWTKWSYDETLDAIQAAGYRTTGLLTPTKADLFTGSAATPEYLAALKQKNRRARPHRQHDGVAGQERRPARRRHRRHPQAAENGRTVGVQFALTFGVDRPEHHAQYFKVMADAAAFAQERGIKLVLKPHGGGSGLPTKSATPSRPSRTPISGVV